MWKITRNGAVILLLSLVVARFVDLWTGAVVALVGAGVLAVGVVLDGRARRLAVAAPSANWAEEFTARVRAERAAAARRAADEPATDDAASRPTGAEPSSPATPTAPAVG